MPSQARTCWLRRYRSRLERQPADMDCDSGAIAINLDRYVTGRAIRRDARTITMVLEVTELPTGCGAKRSWLDLPTG
jgi:hypothetical protein